MTQIDALDGALSIDKAELKTLATPFYFTQASGKVDVASSVSVRCPSGEVLITFPQWTQEPQEIRQLNLPALTQ